VEENPKLDRSRPIANTVMASVFFVMSVLVTLTRASLWATIIMGLISIWALGVLVVNAIAIKKGLPAMEEPPKTDVSE
jgi:hypothetical protein